MIILKNIYVFLGFFSILVGMVGIVIPGLPTTVFLLIAAKLFYHGNKKFHDWLLNSRILGDFIRDYNRKKGMEPKTKISSIIIMWVMISISLLFLEHPINLLVISLGITGMLCIIYIVPKARETID